MLKFVVNNKKVTTRAAESTQLLSVLRNQLGLRAAKYGCGTGHCGACTVLVDGRPENSCEFPVSLVEGRTVTTLEGLTNGDLHPVQQAGWKEKYCVLEEIGGTAERVEALEAGVVAACFVNPPFDRSLINQGFVRLASTLEAFPEYPGPVVAARRSWINRHRDVVDQFTDAREN